MTSGALLLAKSREAAGELATAFRERRVAKFYVAIADKKPKKAQGTVKGDMARTRRAAWRLLRECARPAVTQFVSATYREEEGGPDGRGGAPLRLFVMKPLTGRTHQACCPLPRPPSLPYRLDTPRPCSRANRTRLVPPPVLTGARSRRPRRASRHGSRQLRVALRSLAAPIVGDSLYYPGGATGEDRAYLHAAGARPARRPPARSCTPPARTKLHETGAVGTWRLHAQPDRAARRQRCGCRCAGEQCRWWFRRGTEELRVGGASPTRGCARRSAVPIPSHLRRVSLQYKADADPAPA